MVDGTIIHSTIDELVTYIISRGGTWWSHNGGNYDCLAIVECLRARGDMMAISLSGSRITRAVGRGITLCDSFGIIPLGLDTAARMSGDVVSDLNWPCDCGRHCGGYCAIRERMPASRMRQLAQYCANDAEVLMRALLALVAFADTHDFDLRGTIGGAAWATAQRVLCIPDADYPASMWRRIYNGYYSGRCQVFKPISTGGTHWDITASYPHSLSVARLPSGPASEHGFRESSRALDRCQPGIYSCTINVPECHVPPLPYRWSSGLAFPVGYVSGCWTLPEIEHAISMGCSIEDVQWCTVWPRTENVFGDWISSISNLRVRLGKESPFGPWLRLFANSLTGKLAENPSRRFVRLNPPMKDIKWCRCQGGKCTCEPYKQLDMWGELWTVPYYRQAASGHIQWAAYVTSLARIQLEHGMASAGNRLVYVDTDSVWSESRSAPGSVGNAPGQWSAKGAWSGWECAAPKCYAFTDGDGSRIVRSAGIRLLPSEWQVGRAEQDRGVHSLVDAARTSGDEMTGHRGLFRSRHHVWTMPSRGRSTGWYGDRLLDHSSGITHAVTVHELRTRQERREESTTLQEARD